MNDHLEEILREDMKNEMESVSASDDLLSRIVGGHRRRTIARRRLLAGGGVVGVVVLAAALVFGVSLARGGDQPSGSKVAAPTGSATSPIQKDGKLTVTFLTKVLDATVSDNKILHYVRTVSYSWSPNKTTEEDWEIGGSKWKGRVRTVVDGNTSDSVFDYSGAGQDLTNGIIQKRNGNIVDDNAEHLLVNFSNYIKKKLDSGEAVRAGRQTINGRDTVCIQSVFAYNPGYKVTHTFFLDPVTGELLRATDDDPDGTCVADYSAYTRLPATPENLKLFDLKAVYPNAKVAPASTPTPTTIPRSNLTSATLDGSEILHTKVTSTYVFSVPTPIPSQTLEEWSTGDKRWAYLDKTRFHGETEFGAETLADYTGHILYYEDGELRQQDVANEGKPDTYNDYNQEIDKMISSGQAAKGKHEQIDGRDAVRIAFTTQTGQHVVALLDARTYEPIEYQATYQSTSNNVQCTVKQTMHFDVYEKLPATAENLKMFDLTAFHSDEPIRGMNG